MMRPPVFCSGPNKIDFGIVAASPMQSASVVPGDVLFVAKKMPAQGELVAVDIGESLLVRRYARAQGLVRLTGEGSTVSTYLTDADARASIIGTVVGLYRCVNGCD